MKKIRRQHGASMVEYALLVSLIAVTAIFAVKQFGIQTACLFQKAGAAVEGRNSVPVLLLGDEYVNCQ